MLFKREAHLKCNPMFRFFLSCNLSLVGFCCRAGNRKPNPVAAAFSRTRFVGTVEAVKETFRFLRHLFHCIRDRQDRIIPLAGKGNEDSAICIFLFLFCFIVLHRIFYGIIQQDRDHLPDTLLIPTECNLPCNLCLNLQPFAFRECTERLRGLGHGITE